MFNTVVTAKMARKLALDSVFMEVKDRDQEFAWHMRKISENIEARRLGGGVKQCALVIIGASGSGKSKLLSHHLKQFPRFGAFECGQYVEGSRSLWIEAPGVCNTKSFAIALLWAIGIRARSATPEFELYHILKYNLMKLGIECVIVDEMQHVVRGAQEAKIKKVQDVLKSLLQIDDWPIHFILAGTADVKNFLEGDRQLANRCRVMRLLPVPLNGGTPFVDRVINEILVKKAGLKIGWTNSDNVQGRLIKASSEAMGTLISIVREACFLAIDEDRDTVTVNDFAQVYRVNTGCVKNDNIFTAAAWETLKPSKAVSDLITSE